ncbi:Two-component response regulator ARR9 [Dendrobium catenatum]|uniref:Two-component response regulator ARR9 n=1 Tax=Dendrobium catenatum TaxID=906689 RepID=A0A2I0VJ85_9ASPA|nr:Two-component response regulator ARR9 [Dendrobium catenatum]
MTIAADAPRFHVLAVDDSITDRKLIERLLKTSSYQVTVVDSVSKALQFLGLLEDGTTATPPGQKVVSFLVRMDVDVNLIITDYCMPEMTGYDLLKKIKESSLLKDIPVVIMSSENVPSRINRCLEEGADEFFLKPVQLSDMKKLRPHILKGKSMDSNESTSTPSSSSKKKSSNEGILPEWTKTRLNLPWSFLSYFSSSTCNY